VQKKVKLAVQVPDIGWPRGKQKGEDKKKREYLEVTVKKRFHQH